MKYLLFHQIVWQLSFSQRAPAPCYYQKRPWRVRLRVHTHMHRLNERGLYILHTISIVLVYFAQNTTKCAYLQTCVSQIEYKLTWITCVSIPVMSKKKYDSPIVKYVVHLNLVSNRLACLLNRWTKSTAQKAQTIVFVVLRVYYRNRTRPKEIEVKIDFFCDICTKFILEIVLNVLNASSFHC